MTACLSGSSPAPRGPFAPGEGGRGAATGGEKGSWTLIMGGSNAIVYMLAILNQFAPYLWRVSMPPTGATGLGTGKLDVLDLVFNPDLSVARNEWMNLGENGQGIFMKVV